MASQKVGGGCAKRDRNRQKAKRRGVSPTSRYVKGLISFEQYWKMVGGTKTRAQAKAITTVVRSK